jgi:hypothetical protein
MLLPTCICAHEAHRKEVSLTIDMPEGWLSASEVQQLGATLGSSLKQLVLVETELTKDFWPAVQADLRGLQQLAVGDKVQLGTCAGTCAMGTCAIGDKVQLGAGCWVLCLQYIRVLWVR